MISAALLIIEKIVSLFFKGAQLAAKVALSRVTFIITFVGSVVGTITVICDALEDSSSMLSQMFGAINSISMNVAQWVEGNEYFNLIVYMLSLDKLFDLFFSVFFWFFVSALGVVFTALISTIVAILPLISEMTVSAIKRQAAQIIKK